MQQRKKEEVYFKRNNPYPEGNMTQEPKTEINQEKEKRNKRGKIVLVSLFVIVILGIVCFCHSLSTVPQIFQQRLSVSSPENEMGYTLLEEAQDWELEFLDTFDTDDDFWWTGTEIDESANREATIKDGVYQHTVTAKKRFFSWLTPDIQPVSDFYLSVEVDKKTGPDTGTYGIVFREMESNFFYFKLNELGIFLIQIKYAGEWEILESGFYFPQGNGAEPIKIIVIAKGSDFYFFVNDEFVTHVEDDRLSEGYVGISYGLYEEGDQAVFEFDNFELRVPQE